MAGEDENIAIQDLILRAERTEEAGMQTNRLSSSIGAALSSLQEQFGAENKFMAAESQGEGYAKMFAEVAENFSSLFAEIGGMRSTYLPFELAQEIPTVTGEEKTLEEVVDAQAVMESYENTFFRLLGMPSTADLSADEPLVIVDSYGKFVDEQTGNITEDEYMSILDVRQLSITSRPNAPSNGIYDFLSASVSAFDRLAQNGFAYVPELQILVDIAKSLNAVEKADEQSLSLAQSFVSTVQTSSHMEDENTEKQMLEAMALDLEGFNPNQLPINNTSYKSIVLSKGALKGILRDAMTIIEPALSHKYGTDLMEKLWSKEVREQPDSSLLGLVGGENFWKFSYLLFPPVQDGRIAKCINEPKKMVAQPFSPSTLRVVNGVKLRSTLLEAVIRIRLDIISGTTVNAPNLDAGGAPPVTVGVSDVDISYSDIANSMGLIESLMITRLFTAVHGFAADVRKKIMDLQAMQQQSGYAPSSGSKVTSDNARTSVEKKDFCKSENASKSGSRCQLETMKTIEDSILLILGDNETPGVLDIQEGVVRSSGLKNAHLMSAALSVMDVPRRWVTKKISEKDEEDKRRAEKAQDETQAGIATKLGISKGVGAVDLLAFLIAFFTAKEETLLCLLTEAQFADLEEEFPDNFFDDLRRTDTIAQAVNDISTLAYEVYQLFRFGVATESIAWLHPMETPD